MTEAKNLPSISTLISKEWIPQGLSSVEAGIDAALAKLRYRNLIIERSPDNVTAYYGLTLVTRQLALDLFGSGLKLVLFPAADQNSAESEFKLAIEYRWAILRYVPDFEMLSFAGTGKAVLDIFLELVDITEAQFLTGIIECFIDDPAPYQALVDKLKQWQGGASPLAGLSLANPPSGFTEIEYILQQMEAANVDVFESAFEAVIEDLNNLDESVDRLVALFQKWLGSFSGDDIKELLIPQLSASIDAMPVGIQFPPTILREVDALGKPVRDPNHAGQDKPAMLSFNVASLNYSTIGGLEFNLADSLEINFPRSEILKSGLILELHEIKVDFSRTSNIPEAIADGRPEDFVGVYVKDGTITFPAFWKSAPGSTGVIKARNLLIGTGGFSGSLALEAITAGSSTPVAAPVVKFTFGKDFSVSFDAFKIVLKQNAIKESEIKGTLVIPGLKDATGQPAEIRIKVAIRQDGDFDITAHEDQGFKTFECGKIFNLTLKSVFCGKKDDDFYLGVAGSIKFTHDLIKTVVKDEIEIEKLIIWSDGRFEIEGGTIPMPKNIRFPIGPAELSITAIHMGSHQRIDPTTGSIRNFRYFGFDGGVDINPGGVDVRGKGIKFFYPEDLTPSDCYLEIKSIAIDLVIPGSASKETATLLISGFLSIDGTQADPQYAGGISFALPKAKIAGGASMMLRPKVPAFIVDAFVELSTPIPLGSTSLGIYGFRGLFGQRYVATKAAAGLTKESDTWFDYYKVPQPTQGVNISKFEGPSLTKSYDGAFSIGAGVSLATAQDDGKTFSCKLFLLLSLPDLIYLEGKANILGERVGLDGEDPPFFAMLAISSKSVELGAGVSYQLPRKDNKGWILDLNAEMRAAFFFQNSSAWYVNFGTIANPTTARILTIFDAYSYVMLSAAGIAAGAGVTFGFNKSYAGGMVHASVGVYIKVGGFISFERPQIGGFAMLGGHVDVSLMWFSFYLSIDTSLSVEVPKPFYIQGSVHLCVGVTIGFWKFKKHIEKCFDVEFKWEKNKTIDTSPVLPFADLITNPNLLPPAMATNMLSGESFKVRYLGTSLPSASAQEFDDAVLPLDSWVDVEFLKGLLPMPNVDARIGRLSGQAPSNTIDYIPPAEVPHKTKHEYSIKAVEIKAWNGSAWVEYRPYQAMSPPDALTALNANPSAFKDGFWQNSGSGFNKLRLLAETSMSYMQQGQPGWYTPEQFGITSATLFCRTKLRKMNCLRWIEVAPGTVYQAEAWRQTETVLFRVSGGPGTVIDWNSHFGIPRSLTFPNEATAQVVFNKPCVRVDLKLTTFSSGAVIRFYKRETVDAGFVYTLVETRSLTQLQLLAPVHYNDAAQTIAKVEIEPIKADAAAIYALQVQLDGLYRELHEATLDGSRKDALLKEITNSQKEIERLNDQGCRPKGINKATLRHEIPVLERKIKECRKKLASLLAAQTKACQEAAELHAQFEKCFPSAPSALSHEIIEERPTAVNPFGFRFRVYDDLTDAVLFTSTQQYRDAATAKTGLSATLKLAPYLGDYALMADKNGKYFFQLVDTSGQFIAVSPKLFTSWAELFAFVNQTQVNFRAAQPAGQFALPRRVAGKLPCDESLNHLACWNQLPFMGAAGKNRCKQIVNGMLSAREAFCREYNKLYRELYACNKRLLNELTTHCEELTHEVETQSAACQALSDQLAAIQQLLNSLDPDGVLLPPKDFPCSTLLHEACCLSLEDYQFNLSVPEQSAIDQDYGNAVQAIQEWLTPMWRPGLKYCVRLQVTDTVNDITSQDTNFYFGFRTAGPVGHFHTDPFANYVDKAHGKTADQHMLTGLKGYIDYRRSYPDPSGQLIGAKPLFYEDARILLFFTKRYVYHFFGDWPAYNGLPALTGNAMQIIIKDPSENTSIPNPPPPDIITTEIPQAVVDWPADDDPRISEDIRALLNLHNPELLNPLFEGGDCWVSGGNMIKPASVYTSVKPKYLKPLKLYTAIVNNVYQGQIKEVHQYVFQTSRYPDFVAQIKSYRLDDGKGNQRDAVFQIESPLSVADLSLMYDVVSGNMSPGNLALASSWADPFDRLVAGVMKLTPLDAAISTEFNVVRNKTTGAPVAVWIRNPEPFNNPKLPRDVLERSLRVLDGLNVDLSYSVLFSKDGSQAFVMHPARVIPMSQIKFRFTYIEWDGSDYVDRSVVVSDFIPTPTVGVSVSTL
ncbi:MAG TPA: hypothetical protein VNG71_06215 [Pyrinomonadaceae bacterium]|nr:hypothetical protein [Pyrinomonadaceae bacterium]